MMHPLGLSNNIQGKKSCQFLVLLRNAKLGLPLFIFHKTMKAWKLWNEIIKNSQHWTQNEINLQKLINKMINANWNQNGVRTKSWQTHSHDSPWPTLGRNPRFFLYTIFVHGNGKYIQMTKKIPNSQMENLQKISKLPSYKSYYFTSL